MKKFLFLPIALLFCTTSTPLIVEAQAQTKSVSSKSSGKSKSSQNRKTNNPKKSKGKAVVKTKASPSGQANNRQLWSVREANKQVLERRRYGKILPENMKYQPDAANRSMAIVPFKRLPDNQNARTKRGAGGDRRFKAAATHKRARSRETDSSTTPSNASTRAQAGDSAMDRKRN